MPTGYTPEALDDLGEARADAGPTAARPPTCRPSRRRRSSKTKRDVFIYMISGAKVRAPAAAMALIEKLGK